MIVLFICGEPPLVRLAAYRDSFTGVPRQRTPSVAASALLRTPDKAVLELDVSARLWRKR